MRKLLLVVSFVLLGCGCIAAPAFAANNVVDNKAVVEMVHLGLGQDVILAKIHASPTAFDTSPEALAKLKHQHVPTGIITAMVQAGSGGGGAVSRDVNPMVNPNAASFQYVGADGAHSTISPVRVTAEYSARKAWIPFYTGGPETFLFIQGRHAPLHTSASPAFDTNINPVNVRLVHLGEKKDRESRYVVFTGSTTDREVQVTTSRLGNGMWEIKPSAPLQSGEEYAFLVSSQLPMGCAFWACFARYASTSQAYDFGVQ